MSLKKRILFSMIGSALIASLICGIVSIYVSSQSSRESAKEQLKNSCSIHQWEIDNKLAQIETSVNMLAESTLAQIDDFKKFKTDAAYVAQCTERIRSFARIAGENTEGVLTYYVRYNPDFTPATSGLFASKSKEDADFEDLTPTDFSSYDKDDLEHVGWYYVPVNNGKPTWMDPYQNENIGVYMISYVVPLFIDGESVGIVGMDIDFTKMQEEINEISLYKSGYAFLTNASDEILVHPSEEFGRKITECSQELSDFMSSSDTSSEEKAVSYTYKGEEKVAAFSSLRNGMKLVVAVVNSEFRATSEYLFRMILIAFLIALVFSVISGIFLILVDHCQQNIRNRRIKLGAFSSFNFCPYRRLRHNIPVTALRSHRIISICNTYDSCHFRDILPADSVRIPLPVVPLMVPSRAHANVLHF